MDEKNVSVIEIFKYFNGILGFIILLFLVIGLLFVLMYITLNMF